MRPQPTRPGEHRAELRRLGTFAASVAALAALTYLLPGLDDYRPWVRGEPLPLVHLLTDGGHVEEGARGELVRVVAAPVVGGPAEAATDAVGAAATGGAGSDAGMPGSGAGAGGASPRPDRLPPRPPAVATPLEGPERLAPWFAALADLERGKPRVVRTLHWGDSTIAGDGIVSTVRRRLQARFGDGGPGFLAVKVDPRWSFRHDVSRWSDGDWTSLSITFGGWDVPRYGLAGTLSVAEGEARASLRGVEGPDGQRQLLHRFDVYYQVRPDGGSFWVGPRGHRGAVVRTRGKAVWDGFRSFEVPEGSRGISLQTRGDGVVAIYGIALETAGPGITWENFGVAGSSVASLTRQSRRHLATQVERRQPHLLVYETGGNELGYDSLAEGEGEGYLAAYIAAVERLRAGAPEAPCLLIGPLDQATRRRGKVVSKPGQERQIALQRRAADELGCAWWDARRVMGGEGGFARWLEARPRLANTDLMHLTAEGQELVGQSLADAIEAAYAAWKAGALPTAEAAAPPPGAAPPAGAPPPDPTREPAPPSSGG